MMPKPCFRSSCACGSVRLEAYGAPIAAVACHCMDCRAAGRRIEALPGAPPVLDAAGGTAFLAFRKDRMRPVTGAERLSGLKLKPSSATIRYVATCCNAMMYTGFDDAKHWVSMNRDRFEGDAPRIGMRICTGSMPADARPTDLPCHRGYPLPMMAALLLSGLAMIAGR